MRIFPAGTDSAFRRGYTFVEMLAVCAVVALVTGLVIPRVTTGSRRIVSERALSQLRRAFSETGMRARATGASLELVLLPEAGIFQVEEFSGNLEQEWQLPLQTGSQGGVLAGESFYEVPGEVEWLELPEADEDGGIRFFFFPDGEAAGPEVDFMLKGVHYRLVIDSVLGRATIFEML